MSTPEQDDSADERRAGGPRIVVIGADGEPLADDASDAEVSAAGTQIDEPAKVMRIGTMIKQLLDEVRNAPLDDAARARLAEIHERSLRELEDGLAPELTAELRRITLPFDDDSVPSDAELRIAQAQLVGWLEGLFHGIQTAIVAQQMAAQAQLSRTRHALPGAIDPRQASGSRRLPGTTTDAPGQYL